MDDFNKHIDYTFLKPYYKYEEFSKFLEVAVDKKYRSICTFIEYLNDSILSMMEGYGIGVSIVAAGFPLGIHNVGQKLHALDRRVTDVDVVPCLRNISTPEFVKELSILREFYHDKVLKVIIESELLTFEEIKFACNACKEVKVDYIKTCSGYNGKVSDEKLFHVLTHRGQCNVKASGGIKTKERAIKYLEEGVDVIGTTVIL